MARESEILELLKNNPDGLTDGQICKSLGVNSLPLCRIVHKGLIYYEGQPKVYFFNPDPKHKVNIPIKVLHVNKASEKELARISSLPPLPMIYEKRIGEYKYYNKEKKRHYYLENRAKRISYQRQYNGTKEEKEAFRSQCVEDILRRFKKEVNNVSTT